MSVTETDLRWFEETAPRWPWTWAKTFAGGAEHSYVVKGKHVDPQEYERAMKVIWAFGQPQKFYSRTSIELHLPEVVIPYGPKRRRTDLRGVKFWHMSNRASVSGVLNMAPMTAMYGEQDAPSTKARHTVPEDAGACWYDDENEPSRGMVEWVWNAVVGGDRFIESLLDLGAGTGFALDAMLTTPDRYRAVDHSQAMMNQNVYKHPQIRDLWPMPIGEYLDGATEAVSQFDTVVALRGSGDVLTGSQIQQAWDSTRKRMVLMGQGDIPEVPGGRIEERFGYWMLVMDR